MASDPRPGAESGTSAAARDPSSADAAFAAALDGLLAAMAPERARATRICAVPRVLDAELAARLLQAEGDDILRDLDRLRFTRREAGGRLRYHDAARRHLRASLRREDPSAWAEANRSALALFQERAAAAAEGEGEGWRVEALGHRLALDETVGLTALDERIEDARWRHRLGLAEQYLRRAEEEEDGIGEAGRSWIALQRARLAQPRGLLPESETTLRRLAEEDGPPTIRAAAARALGEGLVEERRWSEGIRVLRTGLRGLPSEDAPALAAARARLLQGLGGAYRDLALRCGGLPALRAPEDGGRWLTRALRALRVLPFRLHLAASRRWRAWPGWYWWYAGSGYQDWIVQHLLAEAAGWYGKAARAAADVAPRSTADAALARAEIDQLRQRWSRARIGFAALEQNDLLRGSPYRRARVRLGLGGARLDQGETGAALVELRAAEEVFRRFGDEAAAGLAAAEIGRALAAQGHREEALEAWLDGRDAFARGGDALSATQLAGWLETAREARALPAQLEARIGALAEDPAPRHYLARFPGGLLLRFRALALFFALPPTLLMSLVAGLALIPLVLVLEGELRLFSLGTRGATALADAVVLGLFATLPLLFALWLFPFVYGLLGALFVGLLGRDLLRFEREQPAVVCVAEDGLTVLHGADEPPETLAWPDLRAVAQTDLGLTRARIGLLSRTQLRGQDGELLVEGVTAGYGALQRDLRRRLARAGLAEAWHLLRVDLLAPRWMLGTLLAAVLLAALAYTRQALPFDPRIEVESAAGAASAGAGADLPLATITAVLVPTLYLFLLALTHLRLVWQDRRARSQIGVPGSPIPRPLLYGACALWTLLAIGWLALFLRSGLAP